MTTPTEAISNSHATAVVLRTTQASRGIVYDCLPLAGERLAFLIELCKALHLVRGDVAGLL